MTRPGGPWYAQVMNRNEIIKGAWRFDECGNHPATRADGYPLGKSTWTVLGAGEWGTHKHHARHLAAESGGVAVCTFWGAEK